MGLILGLFQLTSVVTFSIVYSVVRAVADCLLVGQVEAAPVWTSLGYPLFWMYELFRDTLSSEAQVSRTAERKNKIMN